jgi:hypothetical protein
MKKSKKIMGCVLSVVLGLFFLLVVVPFCFVNWSDSSRYKRETIVLPDEEKVYVIQESWALHDTRLSITKDSCGCKPANPDTDYHSVGTGWVIYSFTDKGWVIYGTGKGWKEPKIPWTRNKPEFTGYAISEMLLHPEKFGVTTLRMDINKDADQWCFLNLFRKSSSLRPAIRRW